LLMTKKSTKTNENEGTEFVIKDVESIILNFGISVTHEEGLV
jgi:hypothetical protein